MSPLLALLLALVCVFANAFFVAAEFALAKVRPTSLEALARQGDLAAARALKLTQRLDAYLSATQLGITLASLALGWLGEPALATLLRPALQAVGFPETAIHATAVALAFSILSILHIVAGELVPKSLALLRPEAVSRWCARPLRFFFFATWPALHVLNGTSNLVLRALRLPAPDHAEGKLSLEEIRIIIDATFKHEDAHDRKRDLLERVLRGTDRLARMVMVPRVDVVFLSTDQSMEECLSVVRQHGFSRYPLSENGDPDKVVGYIYVKDLLTSRDATLSGIRALKRDPLFVPESRTVGDLLSEFQLTSTPFAVIVDEYGGTSGIVTVEDVLEEIVGEIQDEHDQEAPRVLARPDGSVDVDASLPLSELDLEGLRVLEDENADTVGGYAVAALGHLAKRGDRVKVGRWELVVKEVRGRRVRRVLFVPRDESVRPATEAETEEVISSAAARADSGGAT